MTTAHTNLAQQAVHKFLLINRHLRLYARQMDDKGIKPKQFSVLRFLAESGPATVGQVQEFLYNSPSTASTVISQLEEMGYVTRTRSAADNRVVIVEVTAAGAELAGQTPMGGIPLLRRRIEKLSPERLANLDAALADLMQLMEVQDEA
ncbi:MAG: MarR family transcriptional regulator [Caldilineaceae bacterium]|nr:MarR family transcriptional regulator [Caldilineaceae bacterium]MCB0140034.1 MarR family transcriptional regulator [Caldilineaceae bacterium]MCB9149327.1 MarR family transcriptional regulator [Caldilineaceae bacterium]